RAEHRDERNRECGKLTRLVNRFFPRKELTQGLADIFYVTGDSVIGRLACVVQGTVIMNRSVAVTGVRLAHNRTSDVGISGERDARARCIQGTDEISGRRNGDRLSSVGVGGADAVKLHVRGETSVINEVSRFYAHVAIEEDLNVNASVDGYLSGEIAGDMDGDIGLGGSTLIDGHAL